MKKAFLSFLLFSSIAVFSHANSIEDARIAFSTEGPDRYSDGSIVLDGECYVLVWSKDGNFDGFASNSECVDPEDKIILFAPVAKDGRCPPVLFQVPAAVAYELAGGVYAVYLLDTRVLSGNNSQLSGSEDGKIDNVNAYGATTPDIVIEQPTSNEDVKELDDVTKGQVAGTPVTSLADYKQLRIKAMRIDGEKVFLTVDNIKGFMRVSSGKDVSASDATTIAVETSGEDGDVILEDVKFGPTRFFKVMHREK